MMKKVGLIIAALIICVMFAGCGSVFVPKTVGPGLTLNFSSPISWVIIAVIILIVVRLIFVVSSKCHFECPNCNAHFQVGFFRVFFTPHSLGRKFLVSCPKCGKTGMMQSMAGKA